MKHIALTVGPITDTLILGRKTSEIWMASYLFSSFMKKIILEIKTTTDALFLVPFVNDTTIFETQDDGIGFFHDRFILTSETLDIKQISMILTKHKQEFAKMVATTIKRDEEKVTQFFESYLQTYLYESEEEFSNPILDISSILDSIELHTPKLEAEEDYIRLFLNRNTLLNSQLAKESFGGKPSFNSIEAIAAQESDENFQAQNAQKYIAIVHADGDNLGAYIRSETDSATVSKNLFEFDKKAVQRIKGYGALPLFVGGDDLLFFAPVMNAQKETIFDLVEKLSKDYKDALGTDKSTLSFGISITYYKYPLYEALEKSRKALFEVAKNYKNKNAVAISAQKHSGQSFDFCLAKDEEVYGSFTSLIKNVLNEEVSLPHAIHHKLHKHQMLFKHINYKQLQSSFKNIFNEDIHISKFKVGLTLLVNLMEKLGLQESQQEKLFSMLSTIKLIRGDR